MKEIKAYIRTCRIDGLIQSLFVCASGLIQNLRQFQILLMHSPDLRYLPR